jgi:hypothetical protein
MRDVSLIMAGDGEVVEEGDPTEPVRARCDGASAFLAAHRISHTSGTLHVVASFDVPCSPRLWRASLLSGRPHSRRIIRGSNEACTAPSAHRWLGVDAHEGFVKERAKV